MCFEGSRAKQCQLPMSRVNLAAQNKSVQATGRNLGAGPSG